MQTNRQLLFNHIPKTGGITMRIILNKVYGEKDIFTVNSRDIGTSLKQFSNFPLKQQRSFSVLAGHGAELFLPFMDAPFRVTILREPISLFFSQYFYLKNSPDTNFHETVARLDNIEEYIEYAICNGQDNLMTRYLSGSVRFLADPSVPVPLMNNEGDDLLKDAVNTMHDYDAVIDLARFDDGIFSLAGKLGWKKIPIYTAANRNRFNPGSTLLSNELHERLKRALRWDIALYDEFKNSGLAEGNAMNRKSIGYRSFQVRQKGIGLLSKFIKH